MEQIQLLSQLSREELYAIYQFLLLESRSPRELHRNAPKEQMIDILGHTLSLEEVQYCIEFFEHYDFYEVPVLKWEMIDALPDDLLCALHSIYLDSIEFPETHQELVDSLSQSNYFLKEDARKFYLWFHYFRERTQWEETAAANSPVYDDATVRYDLEDMGVAESFTMENYGDLLAEDAGLPGADASGDDMMVGTIPVEDAATTIIPDDDMDLGVGVSEPMYTMPSQPGLPAVDGSTIHQGTVTPEEELSPLQKRLLASLDGDQERPNVNQTIEINSFNMEAYILEQEEAARRGLSEEYEQTVHGGAPPMGGATMMGGPPPVSDFASTQAGGAPPESVSVNDAPSVVIDDPMIAREAESFSAKKPAPPPPPPKMTPRSTMILDASAIVLDESALRQQEPKAPPPPPGPAQQPKLSDLRTIDLDTGAEIGEPETILGAEDLEDEAIETLEPLEADDEEILEAEPIEEEPEAPKPPGNAAPPRSPTPPKPPPPRGRGRRTPPRVQPRGAAALDEEQLTFLTTLLYRTALLGATYARPQIRAIRIYIQKIMDGTPDQLRQVRDILKRLQAQDHPLVPPPVEELGSMASVMPYSARLQLVHSTIFLLGCKSLSNLERYREFLIDMAVELKLDPADISLFDLFGIVEGEIQLGVKDCLELFGIEEGASEGAIRKAHRKQVRRYHPDQFHTHGPEFVRLAERKMKECNMALEILLFRSEKNI